MSCAQRPRSGSRRHGDRSPRGRELFQVDEALRSKTAKRALKNNCKGRLQGRASFDDLVLLRHQHRSRKPKPSWQSVSARSGMGNGFGFSIWSSLPVIRAGSSLACWARRSCDVEDPGELINGIETAFSQHHGVLMDAWVRFLLSDDHSDRVRAMVDTFVETMAGGEKGLETRFARKFGVIYAAGLMAAKAGLLPWPTDWVTKVVRYCYDLARATRDPDARAIEAGLKAIARATCVKSRFVRHKHSARKPPLFSKSAIGLRINRDRKTRWLICRERLDLVGVKDERLQRLIMDRARECGFIWGSKNATGSIQIRVRTIAGHVEKLRFWRLNRRAMQAWAQSRSRKLS